MGLRAALLLIGWLVVGAVQAQVLVRGTVTDASTGERLVAATIQVEGRTIGTVTNVDGTFSLAVPRLPATILVRHIGYRSFRQELARAPSGLLAIALEPDPVFLEEVLVTGEDPAVAIMRDVLARKAAWRDTVSTSYSEVYSRFLLFREFDLVEVQETIGASWWRADVGTREVTRARRTRPDRSERFLYAKKLPVPNLYDDEIVFEGTRFRGPLHPDALRVYRFRLTSQRAQDGRLIHDIAFSPTNLSLAGFIGTLAVEDSTFDVLSMTARPVVDRIGPPPVLDRTIRLEQRFIRRGGGMLPIYFAANGAVRFGRAGVSYPRARFQQVSGLSLHATRIPVSDSLFESGRPERDDPAVRAGQWLFDWNPGMIPLSSEEAEAIESLRPGRRMGQYFRPNGLLSQYAAVPVSESSRESVELGVQKPEYLKPWLWYNRVDGWHVGLRPKLPLTRSLTLRPGVAFAEAPDKIRWTGSLEWKPERIWTGSLGAERLSAISGLGTPRDRFLMGMATYAGYDDYFDYYDRARRWGSVGVSGRLGMFDVTIAHEEHRSALKNDDYQGWWRKNTQRANPAIDEGTLASLELRFQAGDPEMKTAGTKAHVDLRVEGASEGFAGSDFGFSRWQGAFSFRTPTLMRRRAIPAHLRFDVVAGGGSAGVPIQRQGVLDVATGPVASAIAFRSRRDARLSARKWFALFWEHDFGSAIAERIGLGETNLGILVFGAHGSAWHGGATRRDEIGGGLVEAIQPAIPNQLRQ